MKKLPWLLLLLLPLVAHAGWRDLFDLKPADEKPWVETESTFPAYPARQNLIPFEVSSVTSNRYFVDAASVSVGKDDVVRYTVVIESPSGASNISYEGIRCTSKERRIYAFGHPDRTWSDSRNDAWQEINKSAAFSYQKALYDDYFCPNGLLVKDSAEAVLNLRRQSR